MLDALDGVAIVHVGDFVAEDEGQLVFGFEEGEQAAADHDVPAGKRISIDEPGAIADAESVLDALAIDVAGYGFADLTDVRANFCEIGVAILPLGVADAQAQSCADAHFFLIAYARGSERKALGF